MVQPINYTQQIVNPLESALRGFQIGTAFRESAVKEQQLRQQEQQLLAQQQQQRGLSEALQTLNNKKSPTFDDYQRVALFAPKEQADVLLKSWEAKNKEQQSNELRTVGQVMAALRTNPDVAVKILEEKAAAAENSGQQDQAKAYSTWAELAKTDPKTAANFVGVTVAAIPGAKDMFDAMTKVMGGTGEGYQVVLPEEAKKLGLPSGMVYQKNVATGKIESLGAGGERFEMLSRDEASRLGLPASTAYQRDSSTGKITAVGSGGVTVNMPPQIGTIPQDYRMVYDESGRPSHMEVLPGSKSAAELQSKGAKEAAAAESVVKYGTVTVEEIGKLKAAIKKQKAIDPVTGITGAVAAQVPGSMRKTAEGMVDTIRANIGFDRLNQMRMESPTGGALGNITEQELKFLQSTLGSINLDQKDSAILANLTRLEKVYEQIMKKAAAYPNAAQYGFGGSAPSNTVNVGGKTYSRPTNFTDQQWNDYKKAVGAQ